MLTTRVLQALLKHQAGRHDQQAHGRRGLSSTPDSGALEFRPTWEYGTAVLHLAAYVNGEEVGELIARQYGDPDGNYTVGVIVVQPEFQRQGYASRLHTEAAALVRSTGGKKLYINPDAQTADGQELIEAMQARGVIDEHGLVKHHTGQHDQTAHGRRTGRAAEASPPGGQYEFWPGTELEHPRWSEQENTLRRSEKAIYATDRESLLLIGRDGTVVAEALGGSSSVNFSPADEERIGKRDDLSEMVLLHNHPTQEYEDREYSDFDLVTAADFSFSDSDLRMFAVLGVAEGRVISETMRFRIRPKPGQAWPSAGDLGQAFRRLNNQVVARNTSAMERGELEYDEAIVNHQHQVMQEIAKVFDLEYTAEAHPYD